LVAKGDKAGWKLGDKADWASTSCEIGDLERKMENTKTFVH